MARARQMRKGHDPAPRRKTGNRGIVRARRKKHPRKHTVKAAVRNIDLTKAGTSILLEVFADQEKIGTVELGRGSLRWYGKHKPKPTPIPWSRFAEWMETL